MTNGGELFYLNKVQKIALQCQNFSKLNVKIIKSGIDGSYNRVGLGVIMKQLEAALCIK